MTNGATTPHILCITTSQDLSYQESATIVVDTLEFGGKRVHKRRFRSAILFDVLRQVNCNDVPRGANFAVSATRKREQLSRSWRPFKVNCFCHFETLLLALDTGREATEYRDLLFTLRYQWKLVHIETSLTSTGTTVMFPESMSITPTPICVTESTKQRLLLIATKWYRLGEV